MSKSKISWTNETWNPVTGCSKVSPGCAHCYAERISHQYKFTSKAWIPQFASENVVLHPERLEQPLHWKKPRMVFVNSMSDLFHENVSFDFIDSVMNVICETSQHTFQVLTKRPARMFDYFTRKERKFHAANIENLWLGVSVENQKAADERIPFLLQTPAAIRFLSCEPLLGEIDLEDYLTTVDGWDADAYGNIEGHHIDWVIVGGESGPHYREMNLDWARSIRDQCAAVNVPYFFKQQSGYRSEMNPTLDGVEWHQFPE